MINVKRLNDSSKKTRILNTLSQLQKDRIIRYHQQYPNLIYQYLMICL